MPPFESVKPLSGESPDQMADRLSGDLTLESQEEKFDESEPAPVLRPMSEKGLQAIVDESKRRSEERTATALAEKIKRGDVVIEWGEYKVGNQWLNDGHTIEIIEMQKNEIDGDMLFVLSIKSPDLEDETVKISAREMAKLIKDGGFFHVFGT